MQQGRVSEYSILIREGHLDSFGHVNNATYLQIFEEARWELITKNGYGLDEVRRLGVGPTILAIQILFKRELRLRMSVVIKTQLQSYEGKIGILKQWIEDERGQVLTEVELKMALFDLTARRLVAPTPAWLHAIGAVTEN